MRFILTSAISAVAAALLLISGAGSGQTSSQANAANPPSFGGGLTGGEQRVTWQAISEAEVNADLSSLAANKGGGALANGALRELVAALESGQQGPTNLNISGDSVRVEVLHSLSSAAIREVISGLGGSVYGEVPGTLVEALVPVDRLVDLDAVEGVDYIRPPLRSAPIGPESTGSGPAAVPQGTLVTGEEVGKTNADAWHGAGITGQGVNIGIIDAFSGEKWDAAQAAGELPEPSGQFCRYFGQNCDVFESGVDHGQGVAEIIHEMAPDANLYVATVYTASDIMAAVDYFDSHNVQIISRSETSEYEGPGDGTGPIAEAVDYAIGKGMTWLNAAGNSAGDGGDWTGAYFRQDWEDTSGNDFMEFDGQTELLPFICGFVNGVRWSDWDSSNPTDYDVIVFDDPGGTTVKTASLDDQSSGAPPLETLLDLAYPCAPGGFDIDFLAIGLAAANDGTDDTIEFMTNTSIFPDFTSNPFSASGPMSDSANPGMLSVGAIDPALGTQIAGYSANGPTNDGRIKPDLSAAACVASFTYAPACFNGTSSATPATAGAAALVLSSGTLASRIGAQGTGPEALADYLRDSTVERGVGGADNIYGAGELILGAPPDGPSPSPTEEPTPTDEPGIGVASNFAWYQNLAGPGEESDCDESKPVPQFSPATTGLCVEFDLEIPEGNYDLRFLLKRNGSTVTDVTFDDFHTGNGTIEMSFQPPVPDGVYSVDVFADGDLLGTSEVTVGSGNAVDRAWGDIGCSGAVDPVDSLKALRFDAGLLVTQPGGCPDLGVAVLADGASRLWGDVDCDDDVDPIDSLKVLREDAGLSVSQPSGCPAMGETVSVDG